MANLAHLFKIGEKVKYVVNDFDEKRIYDGTVKEVAADHVLVDIPEIIPSLFRQRVNEPAMPDLQIKHPVAVVRMYPVFQKIALLLYRSYIRPVITKNIGKAIRSKIIPFFIDIYRKQATMTYFSHFPQGFPSFRP